MAMFPEFLITHPKSLVNFGDFGNLHIIIHADGSEVLGWYPWG